MKRTSPNRQRGCTYQRKTVRKDLLAYRLFNDKLIQEVVRMVLEAIYEGNFEYTSHGFRPNRSCHTALTHIQKGV